MLGSTAVDRIIDAALADDIGAVDLTSEIVVPDGTCATFVLRARKGTMLAGLPVAEAA